MNALQIIIASIRIYTSRLLWYAVLGMLLFLTALVSAGIMTLFFLAACMLAYFLGPQGAWIRSPVAILAIGTDAILGFVIGAYLLFASVGAFMHACAQIGAGRKDVNLMTYLEYMAKNAPSFWIIGMVQQAIALIPMAAVMLAVALLSGMGAAIIWAGIAISALLYMASQYPLWLAFAAQVVKREGAAESLKRGMGATLRSPIGSALMLLVIYVMALAPAISLVLYPIYFFLLFAPFAAVLSLTYYEASEGMLE